MHAKIETAFVDELQKIAGLSPLVGTILGAMTGSHLAGRKAKGLGAGWGALGGYTAGKGFQALNRLLSGVGEKKKKKKRKKK